MLTPHVLHNTINLGFMPILELKLTYKFFHISIFHSTKLPYKLTIPGFLVRIPL